MTRGSSSAKVQEWTERLARFQKSGLSVARFCQCEEVSQPSFYQWKRKLSASGQRKTLSAAETPAAAARDTARFRSGKSGQSPLFQPLTLMAAAQAVTIRLPDGSEIQIGDDLRVIESVIGQLLDAQPKLDGQPNRDAQTGQRRRAAC